MSITSNKGFYTKTPQCKKTKFPLTALGLLCCLLQLATLLGTLQAQPVAAPAQKVLVDSSDQIADKIVNSKRPVLVDFWAAWCGPCRLLNPIIKELETEYEGRITFMKVNVDQHRNLSQYFQVRGIPAVFIIKDKTVVNALQGLQPKEAYRKALEDALKSSAPAPQKAPAQPSAVPSGQKSANPSASSAPATAK